MKEFIYAFDVSLFRWLNSWVGITAWCDRLIVFRAEYLLYVILAGLALFIVVSLVIPRFRRTLRRNVEMVVLACVAGGLARLVFTEIIRWAHNRPRPFEALSGVHQLLAHESGGSFPSGHAAFSFALAGIVALYYPRTSLLFFLAAVSMGVGRISAGVHYPSDILGGAVVGIMSAVIVQYVRNKNFPR